MEVLILTEGGKNTGFGHITRCFSFYQAFREKGLAPELIINGKNITPDLLKGAKFRIFDWLDHREQIFTSIDRTKIVIIDSFTADISFYENVSNLTQKAVYIDDNNRLDYPEGIVVNGSVFADKFGYVKKSNIFYLLGTKYMVLRKEYWQVPRKTIKKDIGSFLVTFGGEDRMNATAKVVKLLKKEYPELTKNIIVGKWFSKIKEIKSLGDKKTNLIYNPDAGKMKKIALESDIAISAGGQTLYELARVGLPVIGIRAADNQSNNINGWGRAGFLERGPECNDKYFSAKLKKAICKILPYEERLKRSKIGRSLVDGKGAYRVCDFLLRKCA